MRALVAAVVLVVILGAGTGAAGAAPVPSPGGAPVDVDVGEAHVLRTRPVLPRVAVHDVGLVLLMVSFVGGSVVARRKLLRRWDEPELRSGNQPIDLGQLVFAELPVRRVDVRGHLLGLRGAGDDRRHLW